MNKCLVINLNKSINDQSLRKLKETRLLFQTNAGCVIHYGGQGQVIQGTVKTQSGTIYNKDSGVFNLGNYFTFQATEDNTILSILDKTLMNNITYLTDTMFDTRVNRLTILDNSVFGYYSNLPNLPYAYQVDCNNRPFGYCPSITSFGTSLVGPCYLYNTNFEGFNITNLPLLTKVYIAGKTTASITDLAQHTGLVTVAFRDFTGLTGDLQEFMEIQSQLGRRDCSITFTTNTTTTFNGALTKYDSVYTGTIDSSGNINITQTS